MEAVVKTQFDASGLLQLVEKGSRKAMFRASALLMRMARRKIRYRVRTSSRPGMPPFQHRTGANSFSHSIHFVVDQSGFHSVIGPRRTLEPQNPSGPVPHTLEFGGRTTASQNVFWWQKKNAPMTAKSVSAVASWLKQQGWGPLFMGKNYADVQSQARLAAVSKVVKNRKGEGLVPNERIRRKKAPVFRKHASGQYRFVYYFPVRMRSDRQANRAAKNIVKNFGYPMIAASTIAARPYMGPTLRENEGKILSFWKNIV